MWWTAIDVTHISQALIIQGFSIILKVRRIPSTVKFENCHFMMFLLQSLVLQMRKRVIQVL